MMRSPASAARVARKSKTAARAPKRPTRAELRRISLLVLDFDGVMTDNRVLVDETGREAVWCNRGDGWGIGSVRRAGVDVVVVSTEKNPVVGARCRKLNLPCIQGCDDKLSAVQRLAEERKLVAANVAFVGNDVNDLACLTWVGVPIVVADAEPAVLPVARLVTRRLGGYGAVREVCDLLEQARLES